MCGVAGPEKLLLSAVPIRDLPFGSVLPKRCRSYIGQTHDGPSSFGLEFVAALDQRFIVDVAVTYRPRASIALSRHSAKIRCPPFRYKQFSSSRIVVRFEVE